MTLRFKRESNPINLINTNHYAVNSDGQSFLVITRSADRSSSFITVVLDWGPV